MGYLKKKESGFLRDYEGYFEKVKREYKVTVKIFQGYLDFEQTIKKF